MTEHPNTSTAPGPLSGLMVLDLSRILAGPTCTQLLGDLGAEILKVEKPGAGDDTRKWGPPFLKRADGSDSEESAYYLSSNRNKRSVAVDIARPEGAALVRAMAAGADVLIENFKVGDLARYGLDYAALAAENPGLVYCSISGFGQTGPNRDRAGYDIMAQGYSGIMSLTGAPDGEPTKVGVGIADVMCGMYATIGILAALRHRDHSGEGQHIDLALVDSSIAWMINEGVNTLISGENPLRRGNQHPNIAPYQTFAAADGHLIVAVGNDTQFQRFCALLGAPHLSEDPRYASNPSRLRNRDTLLAALEPLIAARPRDALLASMDEHKVPGGAIHSVREVFETDQVAARGMKIEMPHEPTGASAPMIGNPLKLSKTPVAYRRAPPVRGQHSAEVIGEKLGAEALRRAREAGVIEEAAERPAGEEASGAPSRNAKRG